MSLVVWLFVKFSNENQPKKKKGQINNHKSLDKKENPMGNNLWMSALRFVADCYYD